MSYDYEVLGDAQIKLLDDYVPALSKLKFSQIIDEILNSTRNGMFEDLTLDNDLTVGRDAVITRNLSVEGSVSVGGGYGDTGWTADENGNTKQDGLADFSVGGLKVPYGVPDPTDSGEVGMIMIGEELGTRYISVCFGDGDWENIEIL